MWEFRGIKGGGNEPPSYLDKYRGNLIVLGGGRCVWDDWQKLKAQNYSGSLMAVNDIGQWLDNIEHWVSLHPANFRHWIGLKRLHGAHSHDCLTHTNEPSEGIRVSWELRPAAEFSGFFAIQVGLLLGYEQIVVCGVPMDGTGHFFGAPWETGEHNDPNVKKSFRNNAQNCPEMMTRTRGVSGYVKELFGAPEGLT